MPARPLLPFVVPPATPAPRSTTASALSPALKPSPIPGFTHTHHILPAAFPRSQRYASSPPAPRPAADLWKVTPEGSEDKRTRVERIKAEMQELTQYSHDSFEDGGRLFQNEDDMKVGTPLEIRIDRFVREAKHGDGWKDEITLVMVSHDPPAPAWMFR